MCKKLVKKTKMEYARLQKDQYNKTFQYINNPIN